MRPFKREKILTTRESLQSIAIELHRANEIRQHALVQATKQTKLLESISERLDGGAEVGAQAQAMQGFSERWQPLIDKLVGSVDPPYAHLEVLKREEATPVELQASGIRTTADPEA